MNIRDLYRCILTENNNISMSARGLDETAYFATLIHMKRTGQELGQWEFKKTVDGVELVGGGDVLDEGVVDGTFSTGWRADVGVFKVDMYRLSSLAETQRAPDLSVFDALQVLGPAGQIRTYSHSWRRAEVGDVLHVYADLMSDSEIRQLDKGLEKAGVILGSLADGP